MIDVHEKKLTLEQLRQMRIIRPKDAGSTWLGIQHAEFVDTLMKAVRQQLGATVSGTRYATSPGLSEMVLGTRLKAKPGLKLPTGVSLSLGAWTSNEMLGLSRLYLGVEIPSLGLGITTHEFEMARHTKGFDLKREVARTLSLVEFHSNAIPKLIADLKSRTLSEGYASRLILLTGTEGLIPWERLRLVVENYFTPPSKICGKGSLWTLMTAFASASRLSPPTRRTGIVTGQMGESIAFYRLAIDFHRATLV